MKTYLLVPNTHNKYTLLEGNQNFNAELIHDVHVVFDDIDPEVLAGSLHILHTLYTHQEKKENQAYGGEKCC